MAHCTKCGYLEKTVDPSTPSPLDRQPSTCYYTPFYRIGSDVSLTKKHLKKTRRGSWVQSKGVDGVEGFFEISTKCFLSMSSFNTPTYRNPLVYPTLIYNLTSSGREFNRLRALTHKVSDDVIQKRKQTLVGIHMLIKSQLVGNPLDYQINKSSHILVTNLFFIILSH